MPPLITISGSEPSILKTKLEDISVVDNSMIYPDYKIFSQQGYTVGIARAQINDLISNKMDVASHVAQELKDCMEKAGKPYCTIIPLKAEPCITDHWEH